MAAEIHEYQKRMMAAELQAEQAAAQKAKKAGKGRAVPQQRIDVHETLKSEMFGGGPDCCETHFEKNLPCPKDLYGVSDQHMVLDTFEKVESDSAPERGEFRFNFMVQGVTRDQNIGVKDRLDTVIGVQVCDFCIPVLPYDEFDPAAIQTLKPGLPAGFLVANGALPTAGTYVTNARSQIPFCGRVTLFLKEVGLQSYSDAGNRRHHFEFNAQVAGPSEAGPPAVLGDRTLLTPLDDSEYFLFTDPIQDIHGLTVCFYNPGNVLRFPPDILYAPVASADGAGLLTFSLTDFTNLVNLAVGDRVFIVNFASGRPVLDAHVNRAEGHLVGAGGFALTPPTSSTSGTALTFRLNPDVDVTTLTPPLPISTAIPSTSRAEIRIAKNRVRIPLRFRRVVGRLTNYVAP